MAVAVDAVSATDIVWGNVTTFSGTPITATASLTAVSASVVFSTTGTAPTAFSCTWGGTNIPAVTSADTGNITVGGNTDRATMYGLATTTSGAQTFAGTWTTTAPGYANVMSWKGTDTTTPFKNGTSATGTSVTASITVTSPANDFAVGCNFNTSSSSPTVNQTSWWNDITGLNNNGAGNYTAGAGATVLSTTQTASGQWGYAACDVQVPVSGGPPAGVQNNDLISQALTWSRKFPDSYGVRYRSWEEWKQQTPTVLPVNLRVQRDWPNPIPYSRLNDYTWIEQGDALTPTTPRILTTTLRTQADWPNPQPITWYQSWIDNPNTQLPFPTPFIPFDWPNPRPITWYRSWEISGNSLTAFTQAPFNQDDWPLPRQVLQIDRSWLLNNTIYQPTPPAVINEFGWQLVPGPQQPIQILTSSGLSLTTVVQNPFFQSDWPLPKTYQPLLQTWTQSLNVFFQSETFPFSQGDWPNPQRIVWYKDWALNLLQNTLAPAFQAPFNQFDWPLPRIYTPIQQFWAEAGNVQLPFPTPFFQNVNAPLPVIPQPIDQTWIQELVNFYQANTFPFSQKDYPNPPPVYWFKDYNQNLVIYLPVGIKPFNQSDWPLGRAPSPIDQFYYQALVLNLPPGPPPVPPITAAGRTWTKEEWTKQLEKYVQQRQPPILPALSAHMTKLSALGHAARWNAKPAPKK